MSNTNNSTYYDGQNNINQKYNSNKEKIEADYKTDGEKLIKNRSLARQQQDTYNLIMQKYLPRQMKQAGLGGSGLAQSNIISMNSAQARTIADIENNYLSNKTALDTSYKDALRDNEDARTDELTRYNDDAFAEAKAQAATVKSAEELDAFLDGYGGILNEQQISELRAIGQGAVDSHTTETQDRNFALAEYAVVGVDTEDEKTAFEAEWKGKVSSEQWAVLKSYMEDNIQSANDTAAETAEAEEQAEAAATSEQNAQYFSEWSEAVGSKYSALANDGNGFTYQDYQTLLKYADSWGKEKGYNYKSDSENKGLATELLDGYSTTAADPFEISGGISTANGGAGDDFHITYGSDNTELKVEKGSNAGDELSRVLTDKYGEDPKQGAVVVYNGRIYMYLPSPDDSERLGDEPLAWTLIKTDDGNKSGFAELCKYLGIEDYSNNSKNDNHAEILSEDLTDIKYTPKSTRNQYERGGGGYTK